jgi:uncharacterized protein YjiS (DUF1127 family)
MTYHLDCPDRIPGHLVRRRLARWMDWLHRRLEIYTGRRAAERLLALDDRMLADIGIDRSDVLAALGAPPDVDPSMRLASYRRRRLAADRAARAVFASAKHANR